jgi:hypothetical protein
MTTSRHPRCASSAVGAGLGVPALALGGAPAWLIVAAYALALIAWLIVAVIAGVFPQDSADRLRWWQERRATRIRKRSE